MHNKISCRRDIFFLFLTPFDQKLKRFFVKKLPKLNILSVIAIDLVKIFNNDNKSFISDNSPYGYKKNI